ncbi:3'-5' exonuclease [Sorangium sp. KYC3313]|uniref:3'-5' exonuclease n=1 Tax=Sorangium sp. KYC3313 TaxID=3449740 RepID=UPI003F8C5847
MDLRIADTFTNSLARLTPDEQKAVKAIAFDMRLDLSNPGVDFYKLERAKDKNFWSVSVNADIRLIVHRTPGALLLCYVDLRDKAHAWAERRKLETHPTTGAAQLVEIRDAVTDEIPVPSYEAIATPKTGKRPLFASVADEDLLSYGVPAEWLADVKAATGATLFGVADHLPAEAAEALLELATGGKPRAAPSPASAVNPFEHPDALRRFRVMSNVEELQRALDFPWEKWTIFLHPDQRQTVERDHGGPARVSGSAGTGKTIVALHRAVHLARANPDARVLLTTYSDALANALHERLRRLLGSEPVLGERIDVISLPALGLRLHRAHIGPVAIADRDCARRLVISSAGFVGEEKLPIPFLVSEWEHVVDAWQLATWEAYRDVQRLGRKTRVPEGQRAAAWRVFERTRAQLLERGLVTEAGLFDALSVAVAKTQKILFDHAVVDEAQDLGVAHVRFFAALASGRPNALFFAGDLGQRIFQQPFSWKTLGVDVRGRSRTLRVNYRTSHQIRVQADRLLGASVSDADGNDEKRSAVSVFNGPPPEIETFARETEEVDVVAKWIAERCAEGPAHEIGVFVRSEKEIERAQAAIAKAGLAARVLDDGVKTASGKVSVGTMHLAKGLEFRAVVVMACDDDVIPSHVRIAAVGDAGDLQEIYDTERQLLYVACTRARDRLMVTGVEPGSEFLDDLRERATGGAPA